MKKNVIYTRLFTIVITVCMLLSTITILNASAASPVVNGVISPGEYDTAIHIQLTGPNPDEAPFPPQTVDCYIYWGTQYLYIAVNEPVPNYPTGGTANWIEFCFDAGPSRSVLDAWVLFGNGVVQYVKCPKPSGSWGWDTAPFSCSAATDTATEFCIDYTDYGIAYGDTIKMVIDRGANAGSYPPLGDCVIWPEHPTFYPSVTTSDLATWGDVNKDGATPPLPPPPSEHTVDGVMSPDEYDGGLAVMLVGESDPSLTIDAYIDWDEQYLFVAVDEHVPSWIEFCFDAGPLRDYYDAFALFADGHISHLKCPKSSGTWVGDGYVFIAFSGTVTEFKVDYTDFGIALGDTIKMSIDRGSPAAYWPDGAIVYTAPGRRPDASTWGDVTLSGPPTNIPPVADANGPYVFPEGTAVVFNAILSYDPDGDPLQYRWDFDNDGIWDTGWSTSPTASYTWCDDYTGIAVVEVSDGLATDTDTAQVTVNNVAPALNIGTDVTISVGSTFTRACTFTDPGCDTWSATVDYGDGTGIQPLTLTGKSFQLQHTYNVIGVFTLTVTVIDDDGGSGSDSMIVTALCINTVYVDDDYTTTTPGYGIDHVTLIQTALEHICPGGTIIVYDGEYDEDLIIDDGNPDNTGVTIIGAYECFPTNESAVIQGHAIISVDDITIKYLEFKPTTDAAITITDGVTGTLLEYNKFRRDCMTNAIGVQALGCTIVDAEANWWGAQDGPDGGIMDNGKSANGLGVKNIGQVMVEPWIGIHAEIAEPTDTMEVELGTPVTFDATGSFAYSFGECCQLTKLPMQYLWDFGDGSQSTKKIAKHIFDQSGTYQVTLMVDSPGIQGLYANFMYDWAYATIHATTENTTLTANADGGNIGGYEIIVNEPLQLYGDAYGGNGEYTWNWNFGDQTADSIEQNPIHTYTQPGIYTATLTVISDGETATDTAQVTVFDIDELFVTINDANVIVGIETLFAASIKGGTPPYTLSWDFGDQTTSQENNPTHIYNNPGEYTVTVTVKDNKQKTATDTAKITVQEEKIIEEAEIKKVKGGLGIKATIDAGDNECYWEIIVDGKYILYGSQKSGTINPNEQKTVKLSLTFAFGKVDITVTANEIQKQYTAFALGPLFLKLHEA